MNKQEMQLCSHKLRDAQTRRERSSERESPRIPLWRDNSVGILSSDFWFLDCKGISIKSQLICYRSPWKLT